MKSAATAAAAPTTAPGRNTPALLFRNILRACESLGIPTRELLEDLALEPSVLGRSDGRYRWERVLAFSARLGQTTTREQRRQLGAIHAATLPHCVALAQLSVSPHRLIHLLALARGQLWPDIAIGHRELADGRAEITERFAPAPRRAEALWQVTTAFWAAAPTVIRLPPAEVEERLSIADGCARWVLRLPDATARSSPFEPTPADLAAEVLEMARSFAALLQEGAGRSARECEVLRLQRRLGLTLAEARVARRLAAGADLWSIAQQLEITRETVRTHLKRIYSKTGTCRQAELVALVGRVGDGGG